MLQNNLNLAKTEQISMFKPSYFDTFLHIKQKSSRKHA